jgi:hypothetical protein
VACRTVDDLTRRQWNQVFFRRLMLRPGGVVGAELSELYGDLLSERLARNVEKLSARPAAASDGERRLGSTAAA